VIEKSAAVTPWLFATGTHDMEALYDDNRAPGGAAHGYAGHAARLDLPRTGPSSCPSVYSVVYGNVGVLSLDANDLSTEIPINAGYSRGAQLDERTDPIRAGVATRHAPDGASVEAARDGTTYICCGSGGRPRYSWPRGETDSYRGAETPAEPVDGYLAGASGHVPVGIGDTSTVIGIVTTCQPRCTCAQSW
jgi:hypothetical protein